MDSKASVEAEKKPQILSKNMSAFCDVLFIE